MRETTFKFEVRIDGADGNSAIEALCTGLKAIKDVLDVSVQESKYFVTLGVRARFADREVGKRLHQKLVSSIKGVDGVTIEGMVTNLTEAFGASQG